MAATPRIFPSALAFTLSALAVPLVAGAQGFAALVSPPRFELAAKPGQTAREVVEITNASAQPARFRVKTAEWNFDEKASVTFDETLKPDSCRPWVAIESRIVTVSPGGKYRYRFEIAPPAGTPTGECRFALLIEGDEQTVQTPGGPSFPISGRLAVIVYVTIGDAQPVLEVVGTAVGLVNDRLVPILNVKNSGNAHGRLAGFLAGTDAGGRKLEFNPSTLPVLPGETRAISLVPYREQAEPAAIAYPITISGKLEWNGRSEPFEKSFAR